MSCAQLVRRLEKCSSIRKVLVDYMLSDEFYAMKIQTETKRAHLNPVIRAEQSSGDLVSAKDNVDEDFDENGQFFF
jgi:hypothetical protein